MKAEVVIEEIRGIEKIECIKCRETFLFIRKYKLHHPHEHTYVVFECPGCGIRIGVEVVKEEEEVEDSE